MYNRMIEKIGKIARAAGLEIMKFYVADNKCAKLYVNRKLDQSPVTNADLFANDVILCALQSLTPNIPIISEERLPMWRECLEWDRFWLIDPLDGTKEFLSRNGEFTVNIAFIEYGKPVMGVVYVPACNILYAADNGQAWKIDDTGKRINISVRTSKNPIVVMSRSKIYQNDRRKLHNYLIGKKVKDYRIINIGSSLKFCLIAEGIAQFYPRFSCTKIWDTAAGHAIAGAAGAIVNDWYNCPLHYQYINSCFLNPGFKVSLR